MNPTYEVFHEEYHVAYKQFYDEVLAETTEPFEMQQKFQEKYATDRHLIDCYPEPIRAPRVSSVHSLVLGDVPAEISLQGYLSRPGRAARRASIRRGLGEKSGRCPRNGARNLW